jgi:hypothetical protein
VASNSRAAPGQELLADAVPTSSVVPASEGRRVSALAATIRPMDTATLIFSGVAAVGAVMAVVVASRPLLRLVESKHRTLDAVLQDYEKMFARCIGS